MFRIKNFKRLISAVLCFALIFSFISVYAKDEEKNEKSEKKAIEIKFAVGDNTLKINGKDIKVETPYEIDGTVLVPLRVVTEAFGANVTWDDATQGITLVYNDVTIKLNIDKKNAYINNQILEMLQVPQLINDTAMVPLRFISENFGADVSFDDKTNGITVVKNITESNSIKDYSLILKRTQKEYVGDSYYKWYMPVPKEMSLTDRSFDGYNSYFKSDDEKKEVLVTMYDAKSSDNIDTVGSKMIQFAKDYTLIDNYKKVDSKSREYYYVKYKSKDLTFEYKGYIKNSIEFYILSSINNDASTEEKQQMSDIVSKFILDFPEDGSVEDLSDVTQDGYRIFEDKKMKISLKIPSEWHKISSDDKENEYSFTKFDNGKYIGRINLEIYSKDASESTEDWAKKDLLNNLDTINPKCVAASTPVASIDINGTKAYQYTISTKDGDYANTMYDTFFSNNNYRYNLTVDLSEVANKSKDYYNTVLNSFKFEELDKEEIGKLLRFENDNETLSTFKNETYKYSIDIPASWNRSKSDSVHFYDEVYSVTLNVISNDDGLGLDQLAKNFHEYLTNKTESTIDTTKKVDCGDYEMYLTKYTYTAEDDSKVVVYDYIYTKGKKTYVIIFTTSFIGDSKHAVELFEKIIKTFRLNQ